MSLPVYLQEDILRDPAKREFGGFDLTHLLSTVFDPTEGCRICILTDFDEPEVQMKGYAFLNAGGFQVQKKCLPVFLSAIV